MINVRVAFFSIICAYSILTWIDFDNKLWWFTFLLWKEATCLNAQHFLNVFILFQEKLNGAIVVRMVTKHSSYCECDWGLSSCESASYLPGEITDQSQKQRWSMKHFRPKESLSVVKMKHVMYWENKQPTHIRESEPESNQYWLLKGNREKHIFCGCFWKKHWENLKSSVRLFKQLHSTKTNGRFTWMRDLGDLFSAYWRTMKEDHSVLHISAT